MSKRDHKHSIARRLRRALNSTDEPVKGTNKKIHRTNYGAGCPSNAFTAASRKIADRIDGFDRDDLGESHDF